VLKVATKDSNSPTSRRGAIFILISTRIKAIGGRYTAFGNSLLLTGSMLDRSLHHSRIGQIAAESYPRHGKVQSSQTLGKMK
jgi:hypothetical protein